MPVQYKFSLPFTLATLLNLNLVLVSVGAGVPLNAALAADGDGTYQVRQGETLFEVMRKMGVPVNDIISLNQLPAPYHLRAGQVLTLTGTLPAVTPETYQPDSSGFYVVKAGDTVYEVARKTGIPVGKLIGLNQLPVPYHIEAGQALKLGEPQQGIIII
ncbi:LysM peptidoglycan-binding domain-containing protein [Thiothrix fructosivorans]|jgi:LysM repeat protein|uniref:LysM peptidoglycan-binding domain-containing protein n=1 Tax=Thiothrix fructosivorans TaxID=111770 RepID=A0A8B0SPC0_9GAMM|nr:LysM domain-containing protein [Thiothrix fructosivorans]MBO0611374.1 LysM peptidoglycan-binding domain-containing protein [Thiothrix fructosivorans]QTX13055.1 LysM peptidoglycan-binding domain-containing protein [Thiothrix fructosivorans]